MYSFKTHLPDILIKLASTNYLSWKAQVVPILRRYGLLGYVTNEFPCTAAAVASTDSTVTWNPAVVKWLRID